MRRVGESSRCATNPSVLGLGRYAPLHLRRTHEYIAARKKQRATLKIPFGLVWSVMSPRRIRDTGRSQLRLCVFLRKIAPACPKFGPFVDFGYGPILAPGRSPTGTGLNRSSSDGPITTVGE